MTPFAVSTAKAGRAIPLPLVVALAVAAVAVAVVPVLSLGSTVEFRTMQIVTNAVAALGLNIVFGVAGLLSTAQAAAMAIAAYTTGILVTQSGLPLPIASVAGIVVAAATSALSGLVAARVRSHYFLLITLSYAGIVSLLITNQVELTGGANGLATTFTESYTAGTPLLVLGLVALVAGWYLQVAFLASPSGRALRVAGADESLAGASGISLSRSWVVATAIGGAYAGLAGVLHVYNLQYLGPSDFDLSRALLLLLTIVLGGMGSPTGVIVAAAVLTYASAGIPELATIGPLVYGSAIVILLIVLPGGLAQLPATLARAVRAVRWAGGAR